LCGGVKLGWGLYRHHHWIVNRLKQTGKLRMQVGCRLSNYSFASVS
jgi:hypothetical protein